MWECLWVSSQDSACAPQLQEQQDPRGSDCRSGRKGLTGGASSHWNKAVVHQSHVAMQALLTTTVCRTWLQAENQAADALHVSLCTGKRETDAWTTGSLSRRSTLMETECWAPFVGETQSEQGTVSDKAQQSVSNFL